MTLSLAEIILNNSKSSYNKSLLSFIKRNLKTIVVQGHVKFKFTVAKTDELPSLRKKGIKRLPAMILDNRNFIGIDEITDELNRQVGKKKKPLPPKNEKEVLDDFFKSAIGDVQRDSEGRFILPNDEDEPDDEKNKLMDDYHSEIMKRKLPTEGRKSAMHNAQQNHSKHIDDQLNDQLNDQSNDQPNSQLNNYRSEKKTSAPIMDRPNNIMEDNKDAGDPLTVFNKMSSKNRSDDDQLMRQMLEKIGADD